MFTGMAVFNSSLISPNFFLFVCSVGFFGLGFFYLFVKTDSQSFGIYVYFSKKTPKLQQNNFVLGVLVLDINFWLHEFMYARL